MPLYSLHGVEIAYEKHVTLYEDFKKDRPQVDQFKLQPSAVLGHQLLAATNSAEWYLEVRGFTYYVKKREVRSLDSLWGSYAVFCPQLSPGELVTFTGKDFYLQTVKGGATEVLDQGNIVFRDPRPVFLGRGCGLPREMHFYVMNTDTNLRRLLYQPDSWMRLDVGIFKVERSVSNGPAAMSSLMTSDPPPTAPAMGGPDGGYLLQPPRNPMARKYSLQ